MNDSDYAEPSGSELLDKIEDMARQHCFLDKNVTDSGSTSANADALRTLAQHGRFRIVRESGRMVVGYWPENDPNNRTRNIEARKGA